MRHIETDGKTDTQTDRDTLMSRHLRMYVRAGKAGKLSEGKGVWNPDTFLNNLPDTVIKVRVHKETYMCGKRDLSCGVRLFLV